MRKLKKDNYTITYNVHGEGIPILFIHGFPLSGRIWNEVVPKLSEKYKVIVPDLPGIGNSSFIQEDLTIEELASIIADILKNEGDEKAIIVGHSMGGYIALAFAELFEDMVLGIGLVHSSATADDDAKRELRRKTIRLIEKGGKEPFIRQMIPNLFGNATKHKEEQELISERSLLTENKTLTVFYNAMIKRPDRTHILKNMRFPVMWVLGKQDSIADYKKVIQQSTLASVNFVYVYKDCGHMSMLENAQGLVVDLNSFADYCI